MLEGFETNSGYTGIVLADKLVALYDNTKVFQEERRTKLIGLSERIGVPTDTSSSVNRFIENDDKPHSQTEDKELANVLHLALEQTQSSFDKEACGQTYHYYYDIENDEPSILVYTSYYYDGTTCLGVDLFQYPLLSDGGLPR